MDHSAEIELIDKFVQKENLTLEEWAYLINRGLIKPNPTARKLEDGTIIIDHINYELTNDGYQILNTP